MWKSLAIGVFGCSLWATLLSAQDRYRIETVAGQPPPLGVAATSTYLLQPQGLFADGSGNLYEVEVAGWVRKIAAGTSIISRVAGSLEAVAPGDGNAAANAGFNIPRYVALDSLGNIFVSETGSCVIRRVDANTQIISTYAGQIGNCGYGGDNGPATSALLNSQRGIALDTAGNLYIADVSNFRVRRVDAVSHQITTIAGTGVSGHTGDNGPATSANLTAAFLTFDPLGNLYLTSGGWIRKIDTSHNIHEFAGTGAFPFNGDGLAATSTNLGNVRSMQFDSAGNLYYTDGTNARVRKIDGSTLVVTTIAGTGVQGYSGDGGPPSSATLLAPEGLAIDLTANTIYFTDFFANVIRRISGGVISTYAGGGGPEGVAPTSGFLNIPQGTTLDSSGALYISDGNGGRIRRVDPAFTSINTVAGLGYVSPNSPNGLALSAGFNFLSGIQFDSLHNLFVADTGSSVIRRIDGVSNVVTTFAGMTQSAGFSGDHGPAASAQLAQPSSLAFDPAGTMLYIADSGNAVIRAVTGGTITTVSGNFALGPGFSGDNGPATSAQLNFPRGLAVDGAGNLFIADANNNRIREVRASDQKIVTIAGTGSAGYSGDNGPAAAATLNFPTGIRVDSSGDLLIADTSNSVVRKIHNGTISTVAGNGTVGYSGDGGVSTSAQINAPEDVATDPFGHVFIVDTREGVVRRLTPQYLLTTSVNPPGAGTVTSGGYFDKGTNVNVTAGAAPGYVFTGFTGTTVSSANPTAVSMNSTQNVVANFAVAVPNVVGMTKAAATTAITGAGLVLGTITTASSNTVPAGNVISEAPAAGTLVNSGSAVNLVISGSQPVSVGPASGTAGRQLFSFVSRDALGASSVQYAQFLFSKSGLTALNACYVSYDPAANVFYLLSDDMTQWYGLLGGSSNTIGNAQCTIHGATSGSSKAGTDLTTNVDISFRSGFTGLKTIYQFSGDTLGNGSGWQSMGTWNDTGDPSAVELASWSPNSGSGASQTFTAVTKDGDGASTISFTQLVINSALSGFNGCFIHYDRGSNVFYLLNDAGTAFSGMFGGSGQVSNSQCTLHGAGSGGTVAGSNLTVTYVLDFSAGFAGAKKVFMQAVDNTNSIEVWHQVGSWTR